LFLGDVPPALGAKRHLLLHVLAMGGLTMPRRPGAIAARLGHVGGVAEEALRVRAVGGLGMPAPHAGPHAGQDTSQNTGQDTGQDTGPDAGQDTGQETGLEIGERQARADHGPPPGLNPALAVSTLVHQRRVLPPAGHALCQRVDGAGGNDGPLAGLPCELRFPPADCGSSAPRRHKVRIAGPCLEGACHRCVRGAPGPCTDPVSILYRPRAP